MHMWLGQLLVVLNGWVFLFGDHSCCCHVKYMSCKQVKARMSRKNPNELQFRVFYQMRVGRFTVCSTGLPVILVGKPVIVTSYGFRRPQIRNLNFRLVLGLKLIFESVLAIPLWAQGDRQEDFLVWHHDKSGVFTCQISTPNVGHKARRGDYLLFMQFSVEARTQEYFREGDQWATPWLTRTVWPWSIRNAIWSCSKNWSIRFTKLDALVLANLAFIGSARWWWR
jgi:hypothetical protein